MPGKFSYWSEEDESWVSLSDKDFMLRVSGEYEQNRSELYSLQDGEYKPTTEYSDPWCVNSLAVAESSMDPRFYGSRGTTPLSLIPGTIWRTTSNLLFPGVMASELRTGSGRYHFPLQNPDEFFLRLYVRTNPGQGENYDRRLISVYSDKTTSEESRLLSFVTRVAKSGSPEESNQVKLAIGGEWALDDQGEGIETPLGSLPHGAWTRIEINVARTKGVRIKIFSDPHSHVPTISRCFTFPEGASLPTLRSIDISESGYLEGGNRQPTRVQDLAISNGGWIGPKETAALSISDWRHATINNDSSTAPLPMTSISAGTYVVITALFAEVRINPNRPNIVPPAGFTRLGFEYVGRNSEENYRTVLVVFGRYYANYDSSSKQLSVTGGRSGHWAVSQRHYTNVHPEHPIAVGWEGISNDYLSPNDYATRYIRPPNAEGVSQGDVAVFSAITRANSRSTTSISGWIQDAVANPVMGSTAGGGSSQDVYNNRLNALFVDDQWMYEADSHSIAGFTLGPQRAGGREGSGRFVLRQNRELDFVPPPVTDYPVPDVLKDVWE